MIKVSISILRLSCGVACLAPKQGEDGGQLIVGFLACTFVNIDLCPGMPPFS
jgi:hypothetical protein